MSGDDRLNRKQNPARLRMDLSFIVVVLFAVAGIVFSLVFSHFDPSMPAQLLAP